ncbi:unnamed protein product [Arctogadus glacialis]
MFSVAVLLLLLAAGSGVNSEQLTQPESLTIRPGQPLTIRCQHLSHSVAPHWVMQIGLWVFLLSLCLISCQVYNRTSSSSSASTQTMFSVAVLLLLLAAGSGVNCEQLTQPESLTIQPGQPLTILCQVVFVDHVRSSVICASRNLVLFTDSTALPFMAEISMMWFEFCVAQQHKTLSGNLMEKDWNGLVSGVEQNIFLQFSFNTNHVLCSCTAAAPGCWLWCEL